MKKIISLFLSLTMLFSLTSGLDFSAYADTLTTGKCGENVTYSFDSDTGTLTISGTGDMYEGFSKFSCNEKIKIVVIEKGVTSVGSYAFLECLNLSNVNISDTVISIGDYAFRDCTGLVNAAIGNGLTSIGNGAFFSCISLESINIPNGVTVIGNKAFFGCSLDSINIPNSVVSIGDDAFSDCSNLKNINVGENNINYTSLGGVLFNKNKDELLCYPTGKSDETYKFPDGVTRIGDDSFSHCSNLISIIISNDVTTIGDYAFSSCLNLESVTIGDSVTMLGRGSFSGCENLTSVIIGKNVTAISHLAFSSCPNLTSIIIPNNVTSIGDNAFYDCWNLTSIAIPNSVTNIGDDAFSSCSKLTSITIPNSVTSVGDRAFIRCLNLKKIVILTPNCKFGNDSLTSCEIVYGFKNSTAAEYANSHGSEFIEIYCNYYDMEHIYNKKVLKNATCTNSGEISYTCDRCYQSYTETIPALGGEHVYKSEIITQPTCTAKGVTRYTCSRCGYSYDEENVDILEHNYVPKIVLQPTCIKKGTTRYTCSFCGDSYDEENIDALGHSYLAEKTVEPTCIKDGYKLYTCQICNAQYKEIIKAKGHTVVTDKGVPATCTGSGLTSGTHCSTCGAIVTAQQIISAKGHTYKQTVTPAAIGKNGKIVKKCSACGATITSSIAKISTVSLSAVNYTYNGGVKTPSVTVKDSKGKKLSNGRDYTVTYPSGRKNVGRYSVKIRFKGNYSGTKTLTYNINPKGTSMSKVTAAKKGFKAKWKKQSTQTTGYQLQYSTSSKFKKGTKTVNISKNKTTSKSVKKLYAKKKYYVRVRTYKTVKFGGKNIKLYSGWSKAKAVKTKK